MKLVGFCRFSMLGRGDWTAYNKDRAGGMGDEEIVERVAPQLFAEERLERRFDAFENLFVPSMEGQTDQDFTMVLMSSDRLPAPYRRRLEAICAASCSIVPYFLPPSDTVEAQKEIVRGLGHDWGEITQFRLDDDDFLFDDYIALTRAHSGMLAPLKNYGIAYPNILISAAYGGRAPVMLHRYASFIGCGLAMRHRQKSVFSWTQHKHIPRHVPTFQDTRRHVFLTHRDDNDRYSYDLEEPRKTGATLIKPDAVRKILKQQYGFLGARGYALLGLDP
ncbi:hypothetical protein GI374_09835 [Paracoccus sp. S-4012]|uniref:glycosyltransferase n=1 Tax=Paracoccus sp. S-4012 TaxID=2665648 RepID=UPI0012B00599|nr:glycosyltransferase [Paracoccus sp. S-4012]MRX50740.1 hypothetical protein [Paracoccus sp. S-4012]